MTDAFRRARIAAYSQVTDLGWPGRVALAAGFAGFMALMAQWSIPLPWTPVPFSFQVLGVLVTGAVLGRHYALLSVALYVVAGAIGLRVFADQTSSGIEVLTGYTAGYIVGFAAAAWLVGWYVERRRSLLDRRAAALLLAGLGALALASLTGLAWTALGNGLADSYSPARSLGWLLAGGVGLAGVTAFAMVQQSQGRGWEKLNMFLVMMAGIGIIHAFGVPVLKLSLNLPWSQAIVLGSAVFLPFDLIKAALATALCATFIPTQEETIHA